MSVALNDPIGIPDVGDYFESHTSEYGEPWQMGIAVPLINRKFDFGTVISLSLAADSFSSGALAANASQAGLTATTKDINSLPGNFIQHGDKARIGPSTASGFEGRAESVRVAAAAQNSVNSVAWNGGMLYILDRRGKYGYQLSDPVTVYGSGKGFGWEALNAHMSTLGINRGYSSLGEMGRYSPCFANNQQDHVEVWENNMGADFIGLKITLPGHASYDAANVSGQPAVYNSLLGLAPWRDSDAPSSDGGWDWLGAQPGTTPTHEGVFRYVREHNDGSNYSLFAYNSNVNAAGVDWDSNVTYAPVLTGFIHEGGQFKDTAQALMVMSNSLSDTDGAQKASVGILSQFLYRGVDDRRDASYAKLVPGTFYRFGLTWKGNIKPDAATNIANSQVFAKFQWGPLAAPGGDVNLYQNSIISTVPLLNSANRTQSTYKSDMVTGFVQTVDVDDLDTWDNLRLDIVMKAYSDTTGFYASRDSRGAEIQMFIDNVWLEHEGDIPNASGKGYVIIDHFPEAGTLQANRFRLNKPVKVNTVTSQETIDPTGAGHRYLWQIDASFERVTEEVMAQFYALLRWQDLGYKLTLHPSLPQVPHCLVGEMEITAVRKSFWDLTRTSFTLRFTETE